MTVRELCSILGRLEPEALVLVRDQEMESLWTPQIVSDADGRYIIIEVDEYEGYEEDVQRRMAEGSREHGAQRRMHSE